MRDWRLLQPGRDHRDDEAKLRAATAPLCHSQPMSISLSWKKRPSAGRSDASCELSALRPDNGLFVYSAGHAPCAPQLTRRDEAQDIPTPSLDARWE